MSLKRIIDVSYANGIIDWENVKKTKLIDGVIIRCGYGMDLESQDDVHFIRNVLQCERLNIPYGIYHYCYADSETRMKSEIKHIKRLMNECKNIALGVWLDIEDKGNRSFWKKAAELFLSEFKKYNGIFGVYSYLSIWNSDLSTLSCDHKWIAQYNKVCTYGGNKDAWQFSSSTTISGIGGLVDCNYWYVDYTKKESNNALIVTKLAHTLLGDYGTGENRKKKLGSDYEKIQSLINNIYEELKKT